MYNVNMTKTSVLTIHELSSFVYEASNSTFASADLSKLTKENDHSTTLTYKKGHWSYNDNYFGGEPYGGREVVFYKKKPYWMMVYYGTVSDKYPDIKGLYAFLQEALRRGTLTFPWRGPKLFKKGTFTYTFNIFGSVERFTAIEVIKSGKMIVYTANFAGGLVDQRKE